MPFLLEIASVPSSFSLGQPPHPPRQLHQPTYLCATYPDFHQFQWKKCACSFLQHPSMYALNPSLLKIFKAFALAITDFLFCIIFFSRSKMIAIYKYMLFPILERKLLLIPPPLHLPLNFLASLVILQAHPYCCLHSCFLSHLLSSFSCLLILSPNSSLIRVLSLLCNQKSS